MDYMLINGFNTSNLPGCVVTDFGKVEAAKPKGEKADLYGVNGSYRVLDDLSTVTKGPSFFTLKKWLRFQVFLINFNRMIMF